MLLKKNTGKILSTQDISLKIETNIRPVIETSFSEPAVFDAKSFIFEDFVKVHGKYSEDGTEYTLNSISENDLFSGKPGYVLYNNSTGAAVDYTEWNPGNYDLTLIASNGYGNSSAQSNIQFELTEE